jgi:hypothetical protein
VHGNFRHFFTSSKSTATELPRILTKDRNCWEDNSIQALYKDKFVYLADLMALARQLRSRMRSEPLLPAWRAYYKSLVGLGSITITSFMSYMAAYHALVHQAWHIHRAVLHVYPLVFPPPMDLNAYSDDERVEQI